MNYYQSIGYAKQVLESVRICNEELRKPQTEKNRKWWAAQLRRSEKELNKAVRHSASLMPVEITQKLKLQSERKLFVYSKIAGY